MTVELDACYVVRDHNGQHLAYVCFEDEPGRRSAAKLLSKGEARRLAALGSPLVFFNSQIRLDFRCGEIDRIFKLVSARLAGPYVPNTALGPMLRPFWCNDSTTTLRTLDHWPVIHGDLYLSPRYP
jgi:hypothetical protein